VLKLSENAKNKEQYGYLNFTYNYISVIYSLKKNYGGHGGHL
jgi:hypothetical protein